MGVVNDFFGFFKDENLGELTFETQLNPSIYKHNFFSNDAELA